MISAIRASSSSIQCLPPESTNHVVTPGCAASLQQTLVNDINLSDIDMTSYVTALEPGIDPKSNRAKQLIGHLWETSFKPSNVHEFHESRQDAAGNSPLRIAFIGGGVAGSAGAAAAVQAGHSAFVIEPRENTPTRENLVTINAEARQVLNGLGCKHGSDDHLFQTAGDLDFSERAPIAKIETALQHKIIEGPDKGSILRGYCVREMRLERETQQVHLTIENNNRRQILADVDLVVIASGARSMSPYISINDHETKESKSNLLRNQFTVQSFGHNKSALAYAKFRFPVDKSKQKVAHQEINLHRKNSGEPDHSSFVTIYTGREIKGEPLAYETSILFDCPVAFAEDKSALDEMLQDLSNDFIKHEHLQIRELGKALKGNVKAEQIQKGVALVSHWMTDKSFSDHLPLVGIGDAMAPAHPWTGSGSNLAISSVPFLQQLMSDLSQIKSSTLKNFKGKAMASKNAMKKFDQSIRPLQMTVFLRGLFASQIFEKIHSSKSTSNSSVSTFTQT